jgi:hypothetical protein
MSHPKGTRDIWDMWDIDVLPPGGWGILPLP